MDAQTHKYMQDRVDRFNLLKREVFLIEEALAKHVTSARVTYGDHKWDLSSVNQHPDTLFKTRQFLRGLLETRKLEVQAEMDGI